eukprot:CAMPEP_0116084142 /NCGR_PEP_ID=MMETSP0327-20121206/3647_1 /TAXON_ID=44447 /ORGANISM="Pseudo-nitzschia delicatissima, Strain B596" /LENGTH=313 /DNA_ID=CAMNT_0003575073 /DNA_START=148 /DNA_END=1089 /DNA_ORIENTATION=-
MSSCRVDMVGRTYAAEQSIHSRVTARTSVSSVGSAFELSVDIDPDITDILPSPLDDSSLTSGESLKPCKIGKKIVRFCNVHLREYGTCLGDNPSVSRGAPLSLDWDVKTNLMYSIDTFEKSEHYSANLKPIDERETLKRLSSFERLQLLLSLGYSRKEIKGATEEVERIKAQRFRTKRQLERRDMIRAFLNSIMCFFQFSEDDFDVDTILGDSLSSVRTRISIVDNPTLGTDISQARFHETQKKSKSWGGRRKQVLKEEWQKIKKHRKQPSDWNRKPRDSLDVARHPKNYAFDLSVETEKEDANVAQVTNVCT